MAEFTVFYYSSNEFGSVGRTERQYFVHSIGTAFEQTSVFLSSKSFDEQLEGFFTAATSEFVSDVISARREPIVSQFFQDIPALAERPQSSAELKALIEKSQADSSSN
jgi:2-oxo-4-hydroxy-4-carboxy--5-ureidoimidazoline (OHCU) decarboxylase